VKILGGKAGLQTLFREKKKRKSLYPKAEEREKDGTFSSQSVKCPNEEKICILLGVRDCC